jgi:hypothetical protein
MLARLKRGYAAVAVLAIAATLLIISMTAPVISTTADFSIYNSGWNGTSNLAVHTFLLGKFVPTLETQSSGTDIQIAQQNLEGMNLDPTTSSLIIIGPEKAFTAAEGRTVGDFVRGGGKLLLADDFGSGNSLLEGMGATSRFSNSLVLDLAFDKQPEFAVVFDFAQDPTTASVTTILMNYPSSLSVNSSTTEVLARSSVGSWLDTNGDRLREWGEPRGPFPVMARETMGEGSILLLSDPSVLINGMSEYMDNSILVNNLIDYVCQGRTGVMFDESHRNFFDPISVTMVFTGKMSSNAKIAIASVALLMTLWMTTDLVDITVSFLVQRTKKLLRTLMRLTRIERFLRRKEISARTPMSDDEMIDEIAKEHPEWRIGLVRYLVRASRRHARAPEKP